MLKIYQQLVDLVLKIVGGKGLGKKFPFLWRLYDFFFRLAAPKKYFFHQINNMKFLVDPNEPLRHVRNWMQNYLMSNEYEPVTTKIVEELVKPGHIAIDIGASIGYFSMLLSRCVGVSGRVYSFEPTREGFKYLCENRLANEATNVNPFNLAAWSHEDLVQMPMSSYASNKQWANGVAIDKFLSDRGITKIDFIKMYIDGAEPWAIQGLEKIFLNNPDLIMICEYYPKYIEASNGNPKIFHDLLEKYFEIEIIEGDYGEGYWNYLCHRKKNKKDA